MKRRIGIIVIIGMAMITAGCMNLFQGELELIITSPALSDANVAEEYIYEFTVKNLPAGIDSVVFEWTFGIDAQSTGSETVAVRRRQASYTTMHQYRRNGMYALVVVVKDIYGNILTDSNIIITIGQINERNYDLNICNSWRAAGSGGQGGTIDNWDISMLPRGAEFDIRYDAYSIPDKYHIYYNNSLVLDTGWRGASSYEGNPMYPGGISGRGNGMEEAVFTKARVNTFKVIVFGPGPGTAWNYEIRARCD